MEKITRMAFGASLVIVLIAGLMVPFVAEFNDNIVEKNDNPKGRYMLDDHNARVVCDITESGTAVNDYVISAGLIMLDTGVIKINNGSFTLFDTINNKLYVVNEIGQQIIIEKGSISYTLGSSNYEMPYSELLYPSTHGSYSIFNSNTTVNASNGDSIYLISWNGPMMVVELTDGTKSYFMDPVTTSGENLADYTGEVTVTYNASEADDGKSWIYAASSSITTEGTTTTYILAPNTYDTVGSMSMVITLTSLTPLFTGIGLFVALGIYLRHQTKF